MTETGFFQDKICWVFPGDLNLRSHEYGASSLSQSYAAVSNENSIVQIGVSLAFANNFYVIIALNRYDIFCDFIWVWFNFIVIISTSHF